MVRLTRAQSRERTRERLLDAAARLFGRDGYGATSVERIADEAGFSKGAVYSNFSGKEEIFLVVLRSQGDDRLARLMAAVAAAGDDADAVIAAVAAWSSTMSRDGNWALLLLEHARHRRTEDRAVELERILRAHWAILGTALARVLPGARRQPDLVGALVFELTYAPAMSFLATPESGDLVRLALMALKAAGAGESLEGPLAAGPSTANALPAASTGSFKGRPV